MFVQGMAGLLALTILFMATEGSRWHRPAIEFVFWTALLTAGTTLALLAPDSPLLFFVTVNHHPASLGVVFGLVVPTYSAVVVHNMFESGLVSFQEHRGRQGMDRFGSIGANSMSRSAAASLGSHDGPHRMRRRSSLFDTNMVSEADFIARSKQQYVNRTLDRLTFSSQIRRLAAYIRGQIDERQEMLRQVMADTTADELNIILNTVNLPKLIRHGNNGRKPNNMLRYLLEERHDDLSTIARASILHALMRTQTMQFFPQEAIWSVNLFEGASGAELTLLKNMLDSSGDFNNLFKFVYTDITDRDLRKKALHHIREEGKAQRKDNEARGYVPLKILSDVDDTLSCSGGSFPAGADKRFPRHAIYPGVLALYEEIDLTSRAAASGAPIGDDFKDMIGGNQEINVEVHVPWQQGGGIHDLECEAAETIRSVQSTVQARFNVTPDKQRLVLTRKKDAPSIEDNIDLWKDGNLVFVSARPHVFKDVAENGSYRRFHKLVNDGRMHCTPTMLSGTLSSGTLALVFRLSESLQILLADVFDMLTAVAMSVSQKARSRAMRSRSSKRRSRRSSLAPEPGVEDDDEEGEGVNGTELARTGSVIGRNATNRNWTAVGRQKVRSIDLYAALYPEYDVVFFGDNGQADLLVAELITTNKIADRVRMCFIHKIQSNQDPSLLSSFPAHQREEEWAARNIVFFETYMGAAVLALEAGLITVHGLHRVGLAVHDELIEFFIKYPHRDWSDVFRLIKRDIRRANQVLRDMHPDLQIPVPILPTAML